MLICEISIIIIIILICQKLWLVGPVQKKINLPLPTTENSILRKMGLTFQNPNFNILCRIAFWNRQKWLNMGLIICNRLPR